MGLGQPKIVSHFVLERTGLALDLAEDDYQPGKDPLFGIFDSVGKPTSYGSPSDLWAVVLLPKGPTMRSGFHRCGRTGAQVEFGFHPLGSIESPHELDPETGVMLDGFLHRCPCNHDPEIQQSTFTL